MEPLFQRSIINNEKLEMIYLSAEGKVSQRVIRVINLYPDHVLAYCYSRKEVRTFSKPNILSVLPYRKNKNSIGA